MTHSPSLQSMQACSVPGCDAPFDGKGFCRNHRLRWRRNGDPLGGRIPPGEALRFYREVVVPYDGADCLIWPYDRSYSGYGRINIDRKTCTVSRLVCEDAHGEAPTPRHEAAHSCNNGHLGCVAKNHLSWKTKLENEADKKLAGTRPKGEKHGRAKLTEAQAREIISLRGREVPRVIAGKFGISRRAVSRIHSGNAWSHLERPQ